jgi:hypothetical protein
MRGVDMTAAAVTRVELSRFVAYGDADRAGGHVHMLDRARSVGGGRPQDGGRWDLIAHEVDTTASPSSRIRPRKIRIWSGCGMISIWNTTSISGLDG